MFDSGFDQNYHIEDDMVGEDYLVGEDDLVAEDAVVVVALL